MPDEILQTTATVPLLVRKKLNSHSFKPPGGNAFGKKVYYCRLMAFRLKSVKRALLLEPGLPRALEQFAPDLGGSKKRFEVGAAKVRSARFGNKSSSLATLLTLTNQRLTRRAVAAATGERTPCDRQHLRRKR